jgi:hypothetical protein
MFTGNLRPMSTEKALAVQFEIAGETLQKIRTVAEGEGFKGEAGVKKWLLQEATRFIKSRAKTGGDLSPSEVKAELGIKQWSYRDLVRANAFPGIYYINSRVIRIPRADVEAYKASRARTPQV